MSRGRVLSAFVAFLTIGRGSSAVPSIDRSRPGFPPRSQRTSPTRRATSRSRQRTPRKRSFRFAKKESFAATRVPACTDHLLPPPFICRTNACKYALVRTPPFVRPRSYALVRTPSFVRPRSYALVRTPRSYALVRTPSFVRPRSYAPVRTPSSVRPRSYPPFVRPRSYALVRTPSFVRPRSYAPVRTPSFVHPVRTPSFVHPRSYALVRTPVSTPYVRAGEMGFGCASLSLGRRRNGTRTPVLLFPAVARSCGRPRCVEAAPRCRGRPALSASVAFLTIGRGSSAVPSIDRSRPGFPPRSRRTPRKMFASRRTTPSLPLAQASRGHATTKSGSRCVAPIRASGGSDSRGVAVPIRAEWRFRFARWRFRFVPFSASG